MKTPTMMEFAQRLREGVYTKGKTALHRVRRDRYTKEVVHTMCFWGAAAKFSGTEWNRQDGYPFAPEDLNPGEAVSLIPTGGSAATPSVATARFLGVNSSDAAFDFPEGMHDRTGRRLDVQTIMNLNDDTSLTFPQMGDLLAYFGMRDR